MEKNSVDIGEQEGEQERTRAEDAQDTENAEQATDVRLYHMIWRLPMYLAMI